MGEAVLYALTGEGMMIGLPEVVELEVNRILGEQSQRAIDQMRKDVRLLQQLSGQKMMATAPSAAALDEGIAKRWKALGGLLIRIPFSHEHARSALHRIINKVPPCGENNEQFRDCCIWEASMGLATESIVYLISNDSAFYEGRDRGRGLAGSLAAELKSNERDLRLFPSLKEFLAAAKGTVPSLDQEKIASAIMEAVGTTAEKLASPEFTIGPAEKPRISGYATPVPSVVAVSFSVRFPLKKIDTEISSDLFEHDAILRFEGNCSFDPRTGAVSDIEVRSWSKSLPSHDGQRGGGTTHFASGEFNRRFREGQLQVIE
jgi:hypothetical protein